MAHPGQLRQGEVGATGEDTFDDRTPHQAVTVAPHQQGRLHDPCDRPVEAAAAQQQLDDGVRRGGETLQPPGVALAEGRVVDQRRGHRGTHTGGIRGDEGGVLRDQFLRAALLVPACQEPFTDQRHDEGGEGAQGHRVQFVQPRGRAGEGGIDQHQPLHEARLLGGQQRGQHAPHRVAVDLGAGDPAGAQQRLEEAEVVLDARGPGPWRLCAPETGQVRHQHGSPLGEPADHLQPVDRGTAEPVHQQLGRPIAAALSQQRVHRRTGDPQDLTADPRPRRVEPAPVAFHAAASRCVMVPG